MNITEIHIHPVVRQNKGLIAFAHIIIDNRLMLGSIAIYQKRTGGYRITYPQKGNGYVFHPISKPLSKTLENSIIRELKNVMEKSDDRYNSIEPKAE